MSTSQEPHLHDRRLRATLETIALLGVLLDPEARITFCNDYVLDLTGWTRDEVLGREWFELFLPEEIRTEVRAIFLAAIREGSIPAHYENEILTRDGRRRTVSWSNTVLRTADGRVDGVASIGEDVTGHRAAIEALRTSEERLRRTIEGVDAIVGFQEHPGAPLMVSGQIERILGHPAEQITHFAHWNALIHPDDLPDCRSAWDSGSSSWKLEYRMRRADGTWAWMGDRGRFIPSADGPGPSMFSVVVDITGPHEAAEKVRESEARYRAAADRLARLGAAIEQTSESVVVTDLEARILYVNPAFERTTGYTQAEVMGENPRILKGEVNGPEFYEALWATLRSGETWTGRFINRRKDGTLYPEEGSISPIRDEAGAVTAYVAVKRDVSTQRDLEARLRQAQRLEAVGQLAGGVAHDFNNLLAAIRGYAELALASLPAGSQARDDIDEAVRAADRAAALTRQLLAFSRRTVMEPVVLDPAEVIDGLAPMLRRLLGEHIDLEVDHAPGLGMVRADPGQLEQVIVNLVVNARDAMPDGGRLAIRTSNVELAGAEAEAPEVVPGPHVRIAVSDTGGGMDEPTRRRVFEPFFTTKEPGKGTGMGLATVYGIVRQSAGRVGVVSAPGEGSTFMVDLPRVDRAGEAAAPLARPAHDTPPDEAGGGGTILLVEDNAAIRGLFARVLAGRGYHVLEGGTGKEGLDLAAAHVDDIDLLVTDIRMPGIQGPELARRLRALRPAMRVLFITGFAGETGPDDGELDGGVVLEKPFEIDTFTQVVAAALRGG